MLDVEHKFEREQTCCQSDVMNIQHLVSALSGKPKSAKAFLFVLKLCAFQHVNKR